MPLITNDVYGTVNLVQTAEDFDKRIQALEAIVFVQAPPTPTIDPSTIDPATDKPKKKG